MGRLGIGMRRARATRPASVQPNSANPQFQIKTYGKPAALFSVNRLSDAEAQSQALVRLSHRPSDGLEIQNQLICGAPHGRGRHRNRCLCIYLEIMSVAQKWFSA